MSVCFAPEGVRQDIDATVRSSVIPGRSVFVKKCLDQLAGTAGFKFFERTHSTPGGRSWVAGRSAV